MVIHWHMMHNSMKIIGSHIRHTQVNNGIPDNGSQFAFDGMAHLLSNIIPSNFAPSL